MISHDGIRKKYIIRTHQLTVMKMNQKEETPNKPKSRTRQLHLGILPNV